MNGINLLFSNLYNFKVKIFDHYSILLLGGVTIC
jgi:hypothetical protein